MKNLPLSKIVGLSNLSVLAKGPEKYRTLQRLAGFGSLIETLENRTMMSAVPLVHAVKAKASPKPTKTTIPMLVVPAVQTIAAMSPTSVKLTWADSDTSATGYEIFRSTSGGTFAQVSKTTSRTTFSYVDSAVTSNTSYSYKVEAYNTASISTASAVLSIKTPLATPTNLSATVQSGTRVLLNWTDNDASAAGYHVLRSSDGVHFTQVTNLTGKSAATFTDNSVTSGQSYKYEVQAYQGTNSSALSAVATAITPLAAPSKLTALADSGSLIHLSWSDNDSSATGYLVLRSTDDVHFTAISTLTAANANSFDDKSVLPFTAYYYQVQATTAAAKSPFSITAAASTPLAVPTSVTASATGATSVKLTWNDSDPAAQNYAVMRSTDATHYSQIAQAPAGSSGSWTDKTVTCDKAYYYEIESVNGTIYSAVSSAVMVTTPMSAPIGLTATLNGLTNINLTWTDTDPTTTQYAVLRSTNGSAFVLLSTVTSAAATSYTDANTASGRSYTYDVVAEAGSKQSAASNAVNAVTSLAAPTNVIATVTPANTVVLTWTNSDLSTAGCNILRSADGVNFTLLTKTTGATTNTFTDTTSNSGHSYYYQLQAFGTFGVSAAVTSAKVTTPLLTPSGLTAAVVGAAVNLTWIDKDNQASSYIINRSTDGINFTQLVQINSASAASYVDSAVTGGQEYYYQIQAVATGVSSPVSTTVSVTYTAQSHNTVTITTRYGTELVITATGTDDTISITQSGSTLTSVADGQTTTEPVPSAGLFIYTRGGTDGINVAQSVTVRTTVETIDAAVDDIDTYGSNVSVWDDSTDIYVGNAAVHTVNTFAGGVAKTTGASLADPGDAGSIMHVSGSLWGTGPVAADVNQGDIGDCYFLSSLAAFAGQQPRTLQESAVDMGDGTYAVQFMASSGTPEFVRVSNDISTYGGGSYVYAHPGSSGDLWATIMEKAFAYFRTGANTYASTNSGWMGEVYADLGVNSSFFYLSSMTASSLYSTLSNQLAAGKEVTLGTDNAPVLVSGHAYTLISCSMSSTGVATYVVRNPWGVSGDSLENSQGYATLTFAQMQANFLDCCMAV